MTATKPGKGGPLAAVPDVPDITGLPPQAAPEVPPRPRQITRAKLITTVAAVTVLMVLRYHSTPLPGRTMAGHGFWFLVQDAIISGLVLWLWTGLRHRGYRDKAGRVAGTARTRGSTWYAAGRQRWTDYADRPRGPGPAPDPIEGGPAVVDDGHWAPDDRPGTGLGAGRHRGRRPAAISGAPGGRAQVPAAWRHVIALLADVDGENGQEVMARIAGTAAGLRALGDVIEGVHHHLTADRGYDERALPSLAQGGAGVEDSAAVLETALREVAAFYEAQIEAADDGKRAPHDGHEFET